MTQAKLMEHGSLMKLLSNIAKSGMKLDAQIQLAAAQCVGYSIVDRNITPGKQLLDSVSNSIRKDALVAYFEKYGQFAWTTSIVDGKLVKGLSFCDWSKLPKPKEVAWTDEYEREIMSKPWAGMRKPNTITSQYDFVKEANKFVERFTKLAADETKDVKGKELLLKITRLVNEYQYGETMKHTTALTDEMIQQELETLPAVKAA